MPVALPPATAQSLPLFTGMVSRLAEFLMGISKPLIPLWDISLQAASSVFELFMMEQKWLQTNQINWAEWLWMRSWASRRAFPGFKTVDDLAIWSKLISYVFGFSKKLPFFLALFYVLLSH